MDTIHRSQKKDSVTRDPLFVDLQENYDKATDKPKFLKEWNARHTAAYRFLARGAADNLEWPLTEMDRWLVIGLKAASGGTYALTEVHDNGNGELMADLRAFGNLVKETVKQASGVSPKKNLEPLNGYADFKVGVVETRPIKDLRVVATEKGTGEYKIFWDQIMGGSIRPHYIIPKIEKDQDPVLVFLEDGPGQPHVAVIGLTNVDASGERVSGQPTVTGTIQGQLLFFGDSRLTGKVQTFDPANKLPPGWHGNGVFEDGLGLNDRVSLLLPWAHSIKAVTLDDSGAMVHQHFDGVSFTMAQDAETPWKLDNIGNVQRQGNLRDLFAASKFFAREGERAPAPQQPDQAPAPSTPEQGPPPPAEFTNLPPTDGTSPVQPDFTRGPQSAGTSAPFTPTPKPDLTSAIATLRDYYARMQQAVVDIQVTNRRLAEAAAEQKYLYTQPGRSTTTAEADAMQEAEEAMQQAATMAAEIQTQSEPRLLALIQLMNDGSFTGDADVAVRAWEGDVESFEQQVQFNTEKRTEIIQRIGVEKDAKMTRLEREVNAYLQGLPGASDPARQDAAILSYISDLERAERDLKQAIANDDLMAVVAEAETAKTASEALQAQLAALRGGTAPLPVDQRTYLQIQLEDGTVRDPVKKNRTVGRTYFVEKDFAGWNTLMEAVDQSSDPTDATSQEAIDFIKAVYKTIDAVWKEEEENGVNVAFEHLEYNFNHNRWYWGVGGNNEFGEITYAARALAGIKDEVISPSRQVVGYFLLDRFAELPADSPKRTKTLSDTMKEIFKFLSNDPTKKNTTATRMDWIYQMFITNMITFDVDTDFAPQAVASKPSSTRTPSPPAPASGGGLLSGLGGVVAGAAGAAGGAVLSATGLGGGSTTPAGGAVVAPTTLGGPAAPTSVDPTVVGGRELVEQGQAAADNTLAPVPLTGSDIGTSKTELQKVAFSSRVAGYTSTPYVVIWNVRKVSGGAVIPTQVSAPEYPYVSQTSAVLGAQVPLGNFIGFMTGGRTGFASISSNYLLDSPAGDATPVLDVDDLIFEAVFVKTPADTAYLLRRAQTADYNLGAGLSQVQADDKKNKVTVLVPKRALLRQDGEDVVFGRTILAKGGQSGVYLTLREWETNNPNPTRVGVDMVAFGVANLQ